MKELLGLSGVGLAVFALTDIDDLFVLIAFFSDRTFAPRQVVIGQYAGIAALIGVSALSYVLNFVFPAEWVGLIGLVPIAMGIKLALKGREEEGEGEIRAPRAFAGGARWLVVASVTVANGGDNLGAYVPLFATSTPLQIAMIAAVFLAMTAVWLVLARALVMNELFGHHLRRWGRLLLPFVLVGLGIYVLLEQGSYRLLGALSGGAG